MRYPLFLILPPPLGGMGLFLFFIILFFSSSLFFFSFFFFLRNHMWSFLRAGAEELLSFYSKQSPTWLIVTPTPSGVSYVSRYTMGFSGTRYRFVNTVVLPV